jgi:AraC-like DNA-binding protein
MSFITKTPIQCELRNIHYFRYGADHFYQARRDFAAIALILDGDVSTGEDQEMYEARSGDIMIHKPNTVVTIKANRQGEHIVLALNLHVLQGIDLFHLYALPKIIRLPDPLPFTRKIKELLRIWQLRDSPARYLNAVALTLELVSYILENTVGTDADKRHIAPIIHSDLLDESMNEVLQYILTHMNQVISRDALAQICRLHPGTFQRLFKSKFGVTPMELVRRFRLLTARKLLENSDHTLEWIAGQCGFSDAAHLSRLFKSEYNETPGDYRKGVKLAKHDTLISLLPG